MAIDALENHLRATPGDWNTWLVYGDHLLGEGDVRGELIRLEHRLHTERLAPAARTALENDVRSLISSNLPKWHAPLPERAVPLWQHGFVVGLEVRWLEDTAKSLREFVSSPQSRLLTSLAITKHGEDAEEGFDEEDFDEETGRAERSIDSAALKAMLESVFALDLSRLTTLSFAYLALGDEGVQTITKQGALAGLTQLDLRYTSMGDGGAKALATSPHLSRVRALHLQRNNIKHAGAAALATAAFPALESIDLRFNPIGVKGAKALAGAPFANRLTRLALNAEDVGVSGAKALAGSKLLAPGLRSVWKGINRES